jgi:hypothetical protein
MTDLRTESSVSENIWVYRTRVLTQSGQSAASVLFALYSLVDKRSVEATEKIVVSTSQIDNLREGFARTWRRLPTEEELQGLIENYIRDELFYRAGRAAGLDRDDAVIRRRVRQKMEFLAEEITVPEPTEEQLAAFLASNPERFRTEDRLTFRQLFLNPSRRTGTIDRDLEQVRAALSSADAAIDATGLGDPFLLGEEFRVVHCATRQVHSAKASPGRFLPLNQGNGRDR